MLERRIVDDGGTERLAVKASDLSSMTGLPNFLLVSVTLEDGSTITQRYQGTVHRKTSVKE